MMIPFTVHASPECPPDTVLPVTPKTERYAQLLMNGRVSTNDVRRLEALSPETREWVLTMLERHECG